MAGQRPDFRFVVKSKANNEYIDIAAFWDSEKGCSGQFDKRNVESIKLKDGRVVLPENVYCNLQKEKNEHDQTSKHESNAQQQAPPNDETPF